MNRYVGIALMTAAVWCTPWAAGAQGAGRAGAVFHVGGTEIVNVEPMANVPSIAGAPFTADATTEFTQMLSDGNRIERRFSTSLARDGKGRTRSEQDVAMLGPLVVLQQGMNWSTSSIRTTAGPQEPPRFTVITDPVEGVTYTLDERMKEARRNPAKAQTLHFVESRKVADKLEGTRNQISVGSFHIESLGTRQFEGVSAEGTRTTTTIPAGQIGNLNPINQVTERWFSKELQMAVLITRRDPQSGDTVYRLTNIVRAEPPPDLFAVPSDYRIVDFRKHIEQMKFHLETTRKTLERAKE
jgi:hypothetical protein